MLYIDIRNSKEIPPGFRDADDVLRQISCDEDGRLGTLRLMQGDTEIPHSDRFNHDGRQRNRHGVGQRRTEKDYNG